MERTGKVTRRNPTGQAPRGSVQGSRGASRVSRGQGRGGQAQTVSDGHVETVNESYESEEDSTYQPGTEPVETPYDGEYDDDDEGSDDDDALERMEELLRQYQQDRQRRRARRALGAASRRGSHVGSRGHVESRVDRGAEVPIIRISKYLKEARDLGCKPFDGTGDISIAAEWIKRFNEAALDMQLPPNMKMRVATRLLEGMASTWWDGVKGKYGENVTWENFRQEFFNQYYSDFEVNLKRREYTNLTQGGRYTVRQLEHKFRELAEFIPEYACDENRMVNHFWDALDLDVRERATQLPNMTFSQVVEQGLKGEKEWEERKLKNAEEAKKRKWENAGPQGSSKRGNHGGGGSFRTPAPPPRGNQGPGGQGSRSQGSGIIRCNNCKRNHAGKCRDPPRCYQCGETGHLRSNCPQLGRAVSAGPSGGTTMSRNRTAAPHANTGHGGASASNAPSVNQGRTQARVYAITEADARANPDSVAVSGRT
ncbi:unnamed protein product [Cuscuta epithymum]|uniref:CCHC-type domain-containing protein n=2 Tax=Cuscuta epithymum TaxID=186058 RepID=A0AAV0G5B1_9ASTE|nr:unnamed protein product [Cuscuta epithymum]